MVGKRAFFLVSVVAAAGLLSLAAPALAQAPGDLGYLNPPGVPPVSVGGTELVRTPPRAQVGGTSQSRGLPVTGSDVLSLVGVGVACVVVGSLLRYRRQLAEE